MSSATRADVGAVRGDLQRGLGARAVGAPDPTLGLWSYFRCTTYDGRRVAWDGSAVLPPEEREFVATAGFTPAGYYDAGQQLPLELRRPSAPFYLARVVVQRFTSLLFGAKRHPRVVVTDDPESADWLGAVMEQSRFWAHWTHARTLGGAVGAVGVGFKFIRGRCQLEVFDARWATPEFMAEVGGELLSLEVRYVFSEDVRAPDGEWVTAQFWYRRVIDVDSDTVWPRVPVRGGEEPDWETCRHIEVPHGLGFCPVVWVRKVVVDEAGQCDGAADCHGAYELIERADALRSQAYRSTMASCDPTLMVSTDEDLAGVTTGLGGALKLEKGGTASFMEANGQGAKAAREMAAELRDEVLVLVRCHLDQNVGGPSKTATEVEANTSSMLEQADLLREQYGETGVRRLCEMLLEAGRAIDRPRAEMPKPPDPNDPFAPVKPPRIVRRVLALPPRREPDGALVPRRVGVGQIVELKWPEYFPVRTSDAGNAVTAAGQAMEFGLVDRPHAVRFVAPFFGIEEVDALAEALEAKKKEEAAQTDGGMMDRMGETDAPGEDEGEEPAASPPADDGLSEEEKEGHPVHDPFADPERHAATEEGRAEVERLFPGGW